MVGEGYKVSPLYLVVITGLVTNTVVVGGGHKVLPLYLVVITGLVTNTGSGR